AVRRARVCASVQDQLAIPMEPLEPVSRKVHHSRAEAKVWTVNPAELSRFLRVSRVDQSSSTTKTIGGSSPTVAPPGRSPALPPRACRSSVGGSHGCGQAAFGKGDYGFSDGGPGGPPAGATRNQAFASPPAGCANLPPEAPASNTRPLFGVRG